MNQLEEIKQLLATNKMREVIDLTGQVIENPENLSRQELAMIYYHRGSAFRRQGDYRGAMNNYLEAAELDESCPARQAYDTLVEILDFYDHDLFNP